MSKTTISSTNNNSSTTNSNNTNNSKNNDTKIGGGIMKEKNQMGMHTDESHKTHFMNTLKAARGDNHGIYIYAYVYILIYVHICKHVSIKIGTNMYMNICIFSILPFIYILIPTILQHL